MCSSDLFLVVQNVDFASYADDNTIYDAGDNIDEVIFSLQESSKKLFKWFADNQMKANEDKCHLIVSTNELTEMQIGDFTIKNSASEKSLGVNIDSKLNFEYHVKHLCNKTNKNLRALARVTPYIIQKRKKRCHKLIFLMQSLTTAPLFGCYTALKIIIESNIYMNNVYD